jgi:hypothetical protein
MSGRPANVKDSSWSSSQGGVIDSPHGSLNGSSWRNVRSDGRSEVRGNRRSTSWAGIATRTWGSSVASTAAERSNLMPSTGVLLRKHQRAPAFGSRDCPFLGGPFEARRQGLGRHHGWPTRPAESIPLQITLRYGQSIRLVEVWESTEEIEQIVNYRTDSQQGTTTRASGIVG